VWSAQTVPAFASGQVDGYFEHGVPFEFWQLLAFYISSNTLSAVPWAIPFGEGQVQVMLDQAEDVLGWYDNMKNVVPTWYQGG
jgi:aminoglycoside phosphotransferase (APT) family kinase protein